MAARVVGILTEISGEHCAFKEVPIPHPRTVIRVRVPSIFLFNFCRSNRYVLGINPVNINNLLEATPAITRAKKSINISLLR